MSLDPVCETRTGTVQVKKIKYLQKKLTWQREAVCLTFWPSSFSHCMDADDNCQLETGGGGGGGGGLHPLRWLGRFL